MADGFNWAFKKLILGVKL